MQHERIVFILCPLDGPHSGLQNVTRAICELDSEVLTPERLLLVRNLVPTAEEKMLLEDLVQSNDGEDQIAKLDLFLLQLGRVSRIEQRLNCIQTLHTCEQKVRQLTSFLCCTS